MDCAFLKDRHGFCGGVFLGLSIVIPVQVHLAASTAVLASVSGTLEAAAGIGEVGGGRAAVGGGVESVTAPAFAPVFNADVLVAVADGQARFDGHGGAVVEDLAG